MGCLDGLRVGTIVGQCEGLRVGRVVGRRLLVTGARDGCLVTVGTLVSFFGLGLRVAGAVAAVLGKQ